MSHSDHTVRGESARPVLSSRTSTTYGKVPKDLASLVIPDCLKVVGTSLDHGDKTFLIFDSFDDDKECDRILIFSSHGMMQGAATAVAIFADGTYRTASNTIATFTPYTRSWRCFIPNFLHDVAKRKGSDICKSVWCHQTFHKLIH